MNPGDTLPVIHSYALSGPGLGANVEASEVGIDLLQKALKSYAQAKKTSLDPNFKADPANAGWLGWKAYDPGRTDGVFDDATLTALYWTVRSMVKGLSTKLPGKAGTVGGYLAKIWYFENIDFVGPILSGTLRRVISPAGLAVLVPALNANWAGAGDTVDEALTDAKFAVMKAGVPLIMAGLIAVAAATKMGPGGINYSLPGSPPGDGNGGPPIPGDQYTTGTPPRDHPRLRTPTWYKTPVGMAGIGVGLLGALYLVTSLTRRG